MDSEALLRLVIYIAPFLIIGVAVRRWMGRHGVSLSEARAEGSPRRTRSRFLLGIWRRDDPE